MPAAAPHPVNRPAKVAQLMRRRLRELRRTPRELAQAAQVPEAYIADLLAGRRRPPVPGRTDVYERMTKFLRLHRNDLSVCARGERGERSDLRWPSARVQGLLLELCVPARARVLERRLAQRGGKARRRRAGEGAAGAAELGCLVAQRLLDVAQGFVRRQLDDEVGIRLAATRDRCTYLEMRMRLLEFLDRTVGSLRPEDVDEFVRPLIAAWDFDLETRALRVVLRTQEPAPRQKRALSV